MNVPTAVIVTTEFVGEASRQASVLGMPDLTPVVIDHPLSTLSHEQIAMRAEQATPQVRKVWLT
ncbi:MAG: hypothetical protein PVSMB1_07920 [Gemmatimonadaceae bacterium]